MSQAGWRLVESGPGFLVVHKAPGLDVHDRGPEPGLCTLVREALGRPVWPVHRLDKDTSGLLLLAVEREAAADLAALFRNRMVEKYYVALADQAPTRKQGLVQGDMVRSRRGSWKLTRTLYNPARTRFMSWSVRPGLRLFVLKPLTGRTHQLRVALKSLGAPILGDGIYHPRVPDWPDRMYLHAHTLRFDLNGCMFRYSCPPAQGVHFLEPRVAAALHALGPPEDLPWPGRG
ncbi:MAG: TIGR01621 family pseudouridine synthase [Desulfovibrionales bacterium]|nr:TIGR01621 family pseudouridine synthase [Desulfovibrionales bacterium]